MNYRSAARELIMLSIPQLPKEPNKSEEVDFEKILLSFTRSLSDYAKKNISQVSTTLTKMESFLIKTEIEHPDNEQHTSVIQPVIPDTAILKDQIKQLSEAATDLFNAIEIPEIIIHGTQEKTKEYAILIYKSFIENRDKVNSVIEEAALQRKNSKKWKIDRMVRLDRDILRVATVELLCIPETPTEVICDEAVKIAEKYGGDESKKFVNGVLGDIVFLAREKKYRDIEKEPVKELE